MIDRRSFSSVALAAFFLGPHALAQTESGDTAIKIVVPFPAGGTLDQIARLVGDALQQRLRQPVVIDNRAGAGGSIGTEFVARAAPEGRTLLCAALPAHVIAPVIAKASSWMPVRDFRGIAGVRGVPYMIAVHARSSASDLPALIAHARTTELRFGSAGNGTGGHLLGAWLGQRAGLKLIHVPYRGQPDAVRDLLAGEIDMAVLTSDQALPLARSGRLKLLAVTSAARSSLAPELPTVAEIIGVPEFNVSAWFVFLAPRKVPEATFARLVADFAAAIGLSEVKARMTSLGLDPEYLWAEEVDHAIAAEMQNWTRVVHALGLKAEPGRERD